MDPEFLSKASSVANTAVVVLTVLAAVAGLVGWHFSSRYRDAQDAALDRLKLQSAVSIAESAARAAEATRRASKAEEDMTRSVAEATAANERTMVLEDEAGKLRERAAKSEKTLIELQEKIKSREISQEQRTRLITLLSAASPKGLVGLGCVFGDAESGTLAEQIDKILKAAGWPTTGISPATYDGENHPAGLFVLVKSASTAPAHATVLQRIFSEAGIQLPAYTKSNLGIDDVHIIVGTKP
jgi:multidrug efflux pump subunit AcrA (membrane-fusion protein)